MPPIARAEQVKSRIRGLYPSRTCKGADMEPLGDGGLAQKASGSSPRATVAFVRSATLPGRVQWPSTGSASRPDEGPLRRAGGRSDRFRPTSSPRSREGISSVDSSTEDHAVAA